MNFSVITILLFLSLGSFAGFLAGLLGIGGGIILVPLFIWAFTAAGFPPDLIVHAAFGTSLAVILPTSFSSTLGHRKKGNVEGRQVLYLAIGGILGAIIGASLAAGLSGDWLKALFGLMLIGVGLRMFLSRSYLPPERDDQVPIWQLGTVGLAGGAFSAFFGVGGGVIAVPLMVIFLRLPIHLAVGNSSALIVVSSFAGALSYVGHGWGFPGLPPFSLGYVNCFVAALVAPLTILAARLGVRVAVHVSHANLVKVFAMVLILVGARMTVMLFF